MCSLERVRLFVPFTVVQMPYFEVVYFQKKSAYERNLIQVLNPW